MKNQETVIANAETTILENQIVSSPKTTKEKKEKKSKEIVSSVIETKIVGKDSLYIYPIGTKGDFKKEKSFRVSRRNSLKKFVDTFILETRIKKNKDFDFPKMFDEFLIIYKGNYTNNDFSVSSLRETINETDKEELELFLLKCKEHISK